ncbi:MAG: UDP-N-acetylmuramate dehydrogenase [Spirochaetia bacterium]
MTFRTNNLYRKTIQEIAEKINMRGELLFDEPMAQYTTLRIGGSADVLAVPSSADEGEKLYAELIKSSVPVYILGDGSNLLVSDKGIRGLVLHTRNINSITFNGTALTAEGGAPVSRCAELAADRNLGGFEFIYGMPGTVAGAVYMNARCYGSSISDIIRSVRFVNHRGQKNELKDFSEFRYKSTPFQRDGSFISTAEFSLHPADGTNLRNRMEQYKTDRERKGHYRFASAGSVFKNNREFGEPTGKIIDNLDLRGLSIGGAQVSDIHGNVIINNGTAGALDVKNLIEHIEKIVKEKTGFTLEREIIFAGEW